MKYFTSFLLLMMSIQLQSQVWVDEGAMWHYSYFNLMEAGYFKITYEKDTLINGKHCQQLLPVQHKFTWDQYGNYLYLGAVNHAYEYTYQNGDTVFYFQNGEFYILYNFGAQAGDTWDLGVDTNNLSCSKSIVQVDSTGTMEFYDETYRWISLSPLEGSSVGLKGMAVERFGALDNYLFPFDRCCDSNMIVEFPVYGFSCFQDNRFPLYNATNKDCDFPSFTGEGSPLPKISIYPNPTRDFIYILGIHNFELEVYNPYGKLMIRKQNMVSLDLSKFSKGIYFLKIYLEGEVMTKKIIKN
ncbi:MAG: T9SS type A sorting domain-containing protein [Bacteroidales bacterium]|nr:T9SS type A sorting domain-containing protein [Bacteroidales bacterium]MCF8398636.1 T9SS type A sorting domain-containing protein [Bacteroidales bacterium]